MRDECRSGFILVVTTNAPVGDVTTVASNDAVRRERLNVGSGRGGFFTTQRDGGV